MVQISRRRRFAAIILAEHSAGVNYFILSERPTHKKWIFNVIFQSVFDEKTSLFRLLDRTQNNCLAFELGMTGEINVVPFSKGHFCLTFSAETFY